MSNRKKGNAQKTKTLTDEITAARKRRRRRYKVRRLTILVFMLVLAFLIILVISNVNMFTFRNIGDGFKTTFAGGGGYPVMLDSTKPVKTIPLKGAYATLTETEVIVNADGGKELQRVQHNYGNPAIAGNGTKFMLYDRGNKSFNIYNRTGLLFSSENEHVIIAADVASNGTAIVLTQGDRSVSELKVLSKENYTTLFTWQGARGFPLFCGISESGNEAYVAGIRYGQNGMSTVLTFIDVTGHAQKAEIEIIGTFMRLWQSGTKYTVLTDKAAYTLNARYEVEASYSFSNVSVIAASKEGGPLAVAFGDNNQADVNFIVLLSDQMQQIVTLENIGPVNGIHMGADRLYLLSGGTVYALQTDGKLVETYETDLKAFGIFLVKNRISVLLPDRIEQPERVRESGQQFGSVKDTPQNSGSIPTPPSLDNSSSEADSSFSEETGGEDTSGENSNAEGADEEGTSEEQQPEQ